MKLSEFQYTLPQELIAQHPLVHRDRARLMVIDREAGSIAHAFFSDIGAHLPPGSVIVVNDSKVVPARLLGHRKTGGEVEILLLKKLSPKGHYRALIRPLGRLKPDEQIIFNGGKIWAKVEDFKKKTVSFNIDIERHLDTIGHMPLPPYIKRPDTARDKTDYQTVYARNKGSVAAPTAGLHFTEELLARLRKEGHSLAKVTLHVNEATFRPVECEDIRQHPMHSEEYRIPARTGALFKTVRAQGCRSVAVGTTSCRVLESFASGGRLKGETNLFIYPGYKFKMTDILVTNFHLPGSTLLILVHAFGGSELMKRAYREAVEKKYRFYSYGDAMLIK